MNKKQFLQFLTTLLFGYCCLFLFVRQIPSSGGVPGLSGLEIVLFSLPYILLLIISSINIILSLFKKKGVPFFSLFASLIFLIYMGWSTNDWNYNLDEALSMYLFGPIVLVIVNVLDLIIQHQNKKIS